MSVLVLIVTHLVAAGAGAFAWPHLGAWWTAWRQSKALKDAQALLAQIEAAKAVVAAAPVAPMSATGTSAPAAGAAPTH